VPAAILRGVRIQSLSNSHPQQRNSVHSMNNAKMYSWQGKTRAIAALNFSLLEIFLPKCKRSVAENLPFFGT